MSVRPRGTNWLQLNGFWWNLSIFWKSVEKLDEETNKCTYELFMLFIDYTYVFRLFSATILKVCSIKKYNKKLCVTIQSKIWI